MPDFSLTYFVWVCLGIAFSVLLPVLRKMLPQIKVAVANRPSHWKIARPYVATGMVSVIIGLLLMAFLDDQIDSWRAALLAGYTADATLQKITVSGA